MLMCASCRDEKKSSDRAQTGTSFNRKSDERIPAIEQEMSNMPQKLSGAGWKTMLWGNDLARSIMALDDRGERIRLMNRYLDSMSELEPSLTVKNCYTLAFRNYEELIGTCTIFEGEPEIAERILGIMRDCIRLHRQEVKKWADAIENEPNRRNRVPLKNIYRGLSSDFLMFTNHIERTYFPWMKSHGLPMERHEHWRRKINAAYGLEATDGEIRRSAGITGRCDADNVPVGNVERKIVKLPMKAEDQANVVAECCENVSKQLTVSSRKEEVLSALIEYFHKIKFDEQSYFSRDAAISDYYQIVSAVADGLLSKVEMPDAIWRFKLDAIDRINKEILRCEREPKGGIYTVEQLGVGMFMTQRQYLMSLKAKRFDFIRRGFEYGRFALYFKSLPSADKDEWMSRLEKVAKRKVVIWDPDNQLMEMPVYVPEDNLDNEGETKVESGFVEQIGNEKIIFHRTKGHLRNGNAVK